MKLEEFWKYHCVKAWEDIFDSISNFIIIQAVIIFVDILFVRAFAEGIYGRIFFGFVGFIGVSLLVFLFQLLKAMKSTFKEYEDIKVSLEPKLQINFEQDNPDYCCDTGNFYFHPETKEKIYNTKSHIWRISIANLSTTKTIENVKVRLVDVNKCLSNKYNVLPSFRLKFTSNDREKQGFVNIAPSSRETSNTDVFVDVVECTMKYKNSNKNGFVVQHIEKTADSYNELHLYYDNLETNNCKIKIEVSGKDVVCKPKYFMIGLEDSFIKMWEIKDILNLLD